MGEEELEVKAYGDKLNNKLMKDAQSNVDTLINMFTEIPHARLPEHLFKEHFLKFFTGEWTEEELEERQTRQAWNDITGSSKTPLDIIDEEGNVILTVPRSISGLSVKQIVAMSYDKNRTLKSSLDMAHLKNSNLEGSGNTHYYHLAKVMVDQVFGTDHDEKEVVEWMKIYHHFGVFKDIKVPGVETEDKKPTGKLTEAAEDIFDI